LPGTTLLRPVGPSTSPERNESSRNTTSDRPLLIADAEPQFRRVAAHHDVAGGLSVLTVPKAASAMRGMSIV
jgi:hypothetical protein